MRLLLIPTAAVLVLGLVAYFGGMRPFLIALSVLVLGVLGYAGFLYWHYTQLFPAASTEVVELTPDKRAVLERLRAETKFEREDYPRWTTPDRTRSRMACAPGRR